LSGNDIRRVPRISQETRRGGQQVDGRRTANQIQHAGQHLGLNDVTSEDIAKQLADTLNETIGIETEIVDETDIPQEAQAEHQTREIYNSDLSNKEKEIIQNFIVHLSDEDMKQGRHILIEDGFLYDFNHAPTKKSHSENLLDGGDGFEIMHKYKVQELTQEQLTELKRNMTELQNFIVDGFHALGAQKEAAIGAIALLKTEEQQNQLLDWMLERGEDNPPTQGELMDKVYEIAKT